MLTKSLSQSWYLKLRKYCTDNQVTVNDVLLTTYFRVLSDVLDKRGEPLSIPIMIDMRRYLEDKREEALTNLSSTVIISTIVDPGEDFYHTLRKVHAQMENKKERYLGLSTFVKLDSLYKILRRLSYCVLKNSLKNPTICMTNIGVIDSKKLKFEGTMVENAYACGSIKYRPHFQIAVTSFSDTITVCLNLYGSRENQENFGKFLSLLEKELYQIS
ncbi:MAG TPA: WS/DGAT domain-containing protein [Mobilitalea sp.]|nr:WS/DGAT domain-containing protein [Mobilitalea sp.]